jgi:phosphoribosylglycinamide formyltransferase-1
MKNIAIFASGAGSNAENIIRRFDGSERARIVLIVSDNPAAGVLARADRLGVPAAVVARADLRGGGAVTLGLLEEFGVDYIVLAGFLSLVPAEIIRKFRGRIVNIHPALLPAYGGKGMYGDHVHRAVIAAGERESGITIHHVNEHYDSGDIIAQFRVAVAPDDTPDTLAAKIHALEYAHYPEIIAREIDRL